MNQMNEFGSLFRLPFRSTPFFEPIQSLWPQSSFFSFGSLVAFEFNTICDANVARRCRFFNTLLVSSNHGALHSTPILTRRFSFPLPHFHEGNLLAIRGTLGDPISAIFDRFENFFGMDNHSFPIPKSDRTLRYF